MNIAIMTLTSGGLKLAKNLKQHYPEMVIYTSKKFADHDCKLIGLSLSELVGQLFKTQEVLIFMMATGIVVRTIAPYLKHKAVDPAVIVMDEKGQFVISLLSGHLGKANEWAEKIAHSIQGKAVITTASDVNGVIAVDMLAEYLQCGISDFKQAKEITAMLIENQEIGLYSTVEVPAEIRNNYTIVDLKDNKLLNLSALIYISEEAPQQISIPYVWLIPKTLTIGIGCKRGKTEEELLVFLKEILGSIGKSLESIKQLASVSIKQDEEGLVALGKRLRVPLICLEITQIQAVEDRFEGSEFVQETLGVKAVSEPCGYIVSNYGECMLPVQKKEGMTISVWRSQEVVCI